MPEGYETLTTDEKREYVAKRIKKIEHEREFWAKESRKLVLTKVKLKDIERPDLDQLRDGYIKHG